MKKRTSFVARIFAALALIAAVAAVVLIVSAALKDDSSDNGQVQKTGTTTTQEQPTPHRTEAATYTVKPGDTLTSISQKTGVPVSEIQALNPEVDPQVLVEGETLKLR